MIYISMNNRTRTNVSRIRARIPPFHTYRFRPRVGAYCIRPTNAPERGEYVQNRTNVSRTRSRMPPFRMTISCPRVGRNSIHPTNAPERGEYVQNRTNVSRNRARITQNRTNPAYIRKWMTQIHGIRFLPKTFVGRMQYAPTRGRKWYAWDYVVRDWGRKWYARDCGIHDWTQKRYVKGCNALV